MTVTVVVLLGLTLWLTSFGKVRITITKPADTDPPCTIRKGELLEVEAIGEDGGNIYPTTASGPDQVFFQGSPRDRRRARILGLRGHGRPGHQEIPIEGAVVARIAGA